MSYVKRCHNGSENSIKLMIFFLAFAMGLFMNDVTKNVFFKIPSPSVIKFSYKKLFKCPDSLNFVIYEQSQYDDEQNM